MRAQVGHLGGWGRRVWFMLLFAFAALPAGCNGDGSSGGGRRGPSVWGQAPTGMQSGNVDVQYSLIDAESDPILIAVDYSTDLGLTFGVATDAGPSSGSEGLSGLASAPSPGIGHLFVWDSYADLPGVSVPAVHIRITPRDSVQGRPTLMGPFALDNTGPLVAPPVVTIQPVPRQVGNVSIDYTLIDLAGDPADIGVEYSADGGATFTPASEGPGSGGTTGLATSPSGIAHTFVWASASDLGPGAYTRARIRITPSDASGTGLPRLSPIFIVGNDDPYVALYPVPDSSGLVAVTYDLYDSTSDPCSLLVQYSTDSGTTYQVATIAVGDTAGLTSDPAGVTHSFAWNSIADMGSTSSGTVRLMLIPSDAFGAGPSSETPDFQVTNNDAPFVFIDQVDRQDGMIQITFSVVDPQSDPVDVLFEFSLDSGANFYSMTLTPGSVTVGLASSPWGVSHVVTWDSVVDIGTSAVPVWIRAIPSDTAGPGVPFTRTDVVVGNDPPAVTIGPIGGPQSGLVILDFMIIDSTSDPVDITVEYTTDGGVTFFPCTIVAGDTTDLTSAPAPGVPHSVAWDSLADLALGTFTVQIRVVPCDDATGVMECGLPVISTPFTVTN